MSDEEEHSESESYYPDELEIHNSSDLTETNYEWVVERENKGNSQEEIETFVKEQKSENIKKKTVSDMKTFQRSLSSNCDENKDYFRSNQHLICAVWINREARALPDVK